MGHLLRSNPRIKLIAGIVDEEAAFCAADLHDLGLLPPYMGHNRFEVDGADAARDFCLKHQVSRERADLVWQAIALHTFPEIAARMASEIALVHLGAGLELLGLRLDQVPPQVVEDVLGKSSTELQNGIPQVDSGALSAESSRASPELDR